MKIADAQPGILQQPNVERNAQQQATGAQVAQQAFAQQLVRMGALRPGQVQAAQPGRESNPAGIRPDEHGDRNRRRRAAAPEGRRVARAAGETVGVDPASRLDVRI